MTWCDDTPGVEYVLGLAKNRLYQYYSPWLIHRSHQHYEEGDRMRVYHEPGGTFCQRRSHVARYERQRGERRFRGVRKKPSDEGNRE